VVFLSMLYIWRTWKSSLLMNEPASTQMSVRALYRVLLLALEQLLQVWRTSWLCAIGFCLMAWLVSFWPVCKSFEGFAPVFLVKKHYSGVVSSQHLRLCNKLYRVYCMGPCRCSHCVQSATSCECF